MKWVWCKMLTLLLLVASVHCAGKTTPPVSAPATQPSIAIEYATLFGRAKKLNTQMPHQNRWTMNSEHCLLMDDEDAPLLSKDNVDVSQLLRGKVITFVRRPGALDFLFDRLLRPNVPDEEVLVIAQLLIYAGEYHKRPGEALPPSALAGDVLVAAREGRFASCERRYPEAPIREKIENAALRAIRTAERG